MAMLGYFLDRARNQLVLAHIIAPVLWFQATLLWTGLYERYTTSQAGRALEETPFFSGQIAVERLGAVALSGREHEAYLFYLADSISALLMAAAFAALVAFGLRALRAGATVARILLAVTLSVGVFDLAENALLAAALASGEGTREVIGGAAGYATGAKFISFAAAAPLAVLGLGIGIVAWALRRAGRQQAPSKRTSAN